MCLDVTDIWFWRRWNIKIRKRVPLISRKTRGSRVRLAGQRLCSRFAYFMQNTCGHSAALRGYRWAGTQRRTHNMRVFLYCDSVWSSLLLTPAAGVTRLKLHSHFTCSWIIHHGCTKHTGFLSVFFQFRDRNAGQVLTETAPISAWQDDEIAL